MSLVPTWWALILLCGLLFLLWQMVLSRSFTLAGLQPLAPVYRPILHSHVKYYRELSPRRQQLFAGRCQVFINRSRFKAVGFSYVSPEMRILVAAAYVQLTFGWNRTPRPRFREIWLYPDSFYEPLFREQYLWVRERPDTLELSWEKFLRGYKEQEVACHAGLHHLALCLPVDQLARKQARATRELLPRWRKQLRELLKSTTLQQSDLFRYNPQMNPRELEAQLIENFFERPADLQGL